MTRSILAVGFLMATLMLGCGRSSELPKGQGNFQKLGVLYGQYLGQHKGSPPANEKQFKEWIAKFDGSVAIEEIFVSPRDNLPIVVRYGIKTSITSDGPAPIFAHEAKGVDGKVMVVRSTTAIEEIDEATLKSQTSKK